MSFKKDEKVYTFTINSSHSVSHGGLKILRFHELTLHIATLRISSDPSEECICTFTSESVEVRYGSEHLCTGKYL